MDDTIVASKVVTPLDEIFSKSYVARQLGILRTKVRRVWKRFYETNLLEKLKSVGITVMARKYFSPIFQIVPKQRKLEILPVMNCELRTGYAKEESWDLLYSWYL